MPDAASSVLHQKLAERRAREAAEKAAQNPKPTGWAAYVEANPDLIPTNESTDGGAHNLTESDHALDRAVEGIDILAAYRRWCGKMDPKVGKNQRESIMISCPKPDHRDSNPSAWINLDKQTWYCGTCQVGGDAHDIAAYHYGYPVPQYKDDSTFHKLREQMAKDFGFIIQRMPGGAVSVIAPEPADDEDEEIQPPTPPSPPKLSVVGPEPTVEVAERLAPVIEMNDDGDIPQWDYPSLDWKSIIPENTFLDIYMRQCCEDDVAEEFHFWNGLIAVGFALGREARLFDLKPVYANLFVCTLGHSGTGKSKAAGYLNRLLDSALPHDWNDPSSRGVKRVNTPGSAEVLIHSFMKPVTDPNNPKAGIQYYAPVKGMVDFNEMSQLVGRAQRQGNTLKPTLMQFYDMDDKISSSAITTGAKEAHEAFACILTTTQPAAFRTLLTKGDDDSGFLNRWVFVAGPEKKKIAIGGKRIDIEPAVPYLQSIYAWAGRFGDEDFVEWGPEAEEIFTEFAHSTIYPQQKSAASALLSRLDLLMKKLVLLLAGNKMESVVSGQTVRDAMAIYPYILACYAMPEKEMGKSEMTEIYDAVLYQCKKAWEKEGSPQNNGKGLTVSIINRNLARRNYPKDLIIKAIDQLVKLEEIEIVQTAPGSKGRPTTRYRYVG